MNTTPMIVAWTTTTITPWIVVVPHRTKNTVQSDRFFVLDPHHTKKEIRRRTVLLCGKTSGKNDNVDDVDDDQDERTSESQPSNDSDSKWLEKWALEGAKTIAQLDIHERTQRSMLAEKVEDRIYELTVALEKLVDESTGQIHDKDLPKAKEIAEETRNLQVEYRDLVTGAPSTMLKAVASLKQSSNQVSADTTTLGKEHGDEKR